MSHLTEVISDIHLECQQEFLGKMGRFLDLAIPPKILLTSRGVGHKVNRYLCYINASVCLKITCTHVCNLPVLHHRSNVYCMYIVISDQWNTSSTALVPPQSYPFNARHL